MNPELTMTSIIVPAFCECRNLPELVARIAGAMAAVGEYEIIVVDDDSPDQTVEMCRHLSEEYPVRLIVRKAERGLSSAVIAGMNEASGDLLVCMDADLSHPPESLPAIIRAMSDSTIEFAIGSRYVSDGSTDEDWGLWRWLNSRIATLMARPLTHVSDPMAGFFALRRQDFLAAKSLQPIGYKIGLELLIKTGARKILEIPIRFASRKQGVSKMSFRQQFQYLVHLWSLYRFRFGAATRLIAFLCVGASGAVIDLMSYWFLLSLCPMLLARLVGILVAIHWNFLLNSSITFHESGSRDSVLRQYWGFIAACSLGGGVNYLVSMWVNFLMPQNFLLAGATGILAACLCNFLMCDRFVFRVSRPCSKTNDVSVEKLSAEK